MRQTVVAAKTAPFSPPQLTGARPPSRIGRILLAGNEQISTESVLAHVPLVPGQILTARDVQQAEELLAQLGLFVVDPLTGIRPTVTVLDSDGDGTFKDILIKVQEKPATEPTAARSH